MEPTYYLAGPMSYVPQFNYPLFIETAGRLRGQGYGIVSPAELDDKETVEAAMKSEDGVPGKNLMVNDNTWGDFLARDVKIVADEVDGVVVLPGWSNSRGALLETFVAALCGKVVLSVDLDTLELSEIDSPSLTEIHTTKLMEI